MINELIKQLENVRGRKSTTMGQAMVINTLIEQLQSSTPANEVLILAKVKGFLLGIK